MLCEVMASALPAWMGQVICPGAPAWIASGLAVIAALLAILALIFARRDALARSAGATVLMVLSTLLLSAAAARPAWLATPDGPGAGGTLVVLVDQSRSVWREDQVAADALANLAAVAGGIRGAEGWTAQVLGFGAVPTVVADLPDVKGLAEAVLRAAPDQPADHSNLSDALADARSLIADRGGRGVILLMTDGLAPRPDAALIRALIASGIAVHVIPTGSSYPDTGLISADIGPMQNVGVPSIVRGTTLGAGELAVTAGSGSVRQDREDNRTLQPLRAEVVFTSRGLEPVALAFGADDQLQERTLYTLVKGPAQVLVYGRAPWLDALDGSRWQIRRADPQAPVVPEGHDLVVIDSLAPTDFAPAYADLLFAAANGTGILIVNGAQRGAKTDKQVMSLWNDTALSPILPVDSDPRVFVQSPPPRDVVIMIDTSGSMIQDNSGSYDSGRFDTAKSVAATIISQLQPQDSLWIIPFTDQAGSEFPMQKATPEVIASALGYVSRLAAGGGTDPNAALGKSARLRSNQCAFFMISDGDFLPNVLAPQCNTVAIGTNGADLPGGSAFWAQSENLPAGAAADNLRFDYFQPEIRDEYFRPGVFDPLLASGAEWMAQPPAMDGLAISYPRSDSGVEVLAVHSGQPRDPAIVTRRDPDRPAVVTGVILGDIPAWRSAAGAATLDALMTRLTGWNDPDRYDIRLTADGGTLEVTIAVLANDGQRIPATLSAALLLQDGQPIGLGLGPDGEAGVFSGSASIPASAAGQRALLVMTQPDDEQRIPIRLPPAAGARAGAATDEAFDFGIDDAGLAQLARETGGTKPAVLGSVSNEAALERPMPLSAWFIAIAVLAFAASFWTRGFRP